MVLNITIPITSTAVRNIHTAREKAYIDGRDAARAKFSGMTPHELRLEIKTRRLEAKKDAGRAEEIEARLDKLGNCIFGHDDIKKWASDFLVFEKPKGGATAVLKSAYVDRSVIFLMALAADAEVTGFEDFLEQATVFRIEHDWYKAINKADDFDGGSFKLPFEVCTFEFQISHKSVVAICANYASDASENEVVMQLVVQSFTGWVMSHYIYRYHNARWDCLESGVKFEDDRLKRLVELIGNQIRAACIALDAEVATVKLVREKHLGSERDIKEHPDYEFYAIELATKTRAETLQAHGEVKCSKRLHFRRGHWRHFSVSKTWVRWCLVGNPELGFIDKQYRL